MSNAPPTPPSRGAGKRSPAGNQGLAHKPVARKAGHAVESPGEQQEENVAEPEAKRIADRMHAEKEQKARAKKPNEAKKARDAMRERQQRGDGEKGREEEEDEPPKDTTTAGMLAHNAQFTKSSIDQARDFGFQRTPGIGEIVIGQQAPKGEGESLGAMLPGTRMRAHPGLPEADMRPPIFLTPLESMSDIYMRTRGRMSIKTKQLLECTDLEDLLEMIATLHNDETLVRNSQARLTHAIWSQLKDDPGPMLLGLNDMRLTEPWRLFLDRWDIWVPENKDEDGVELFWEGEAEDDDGNAIEIMQALSFKKGELTLHAKMGDLEDRITFDGTTFYRLRSP